MKSKQNQTMATGLWTMTTLHQTSVLWVEGLQPGPGYVLCPIIVLKIVVYTGMHHLWVSASWSASTTTNSSYNIQQSQKYTQHEQSLSVLLYNTSTYVCLPFFFTNEVSDVITEVQIISLERKKKISFHTESPPQHFRVFFPMSSLPKHELNKILLANNLLSRSSYSRW